MLRKAESVKTPSLPIAVISSLPSKDQTMAFQKTYERTDGSRVKIEPVLQIDDFHDDAFERGHIVYHAAPSLGKF